MKIEDKLIEIFKQKGAGPFLFVGSGFSRRYLGLEDWKGLLSKFCIMGRPFEYYLATADGNYPTAAKQLAQDFNEYWWKAAEYANSVKLHKSKIRDSTSALRIEISNYLSKLGEANAKNSAYAAEVALLSTLNVDGIITTNWDPFLEQLYPDYKKYIGQSELLFSNPQEIGEIYKIHGCASRPESLTLTSDDYLEFNNRNPYLAAKLITIFVEHPIVFIGYSISDANVASLLKSISMCVGKENIEKLRKNLIFVQRIQGNEEGGISDTYISIEGTQIPLILVKTDDYSEVYRALAATKRKIPARVLRYCKEQLYELVKSLEPEKKLAVVDIDAIEDKEDVEFLVGVGVSSLSKPEIGVKGYETIEIQDLIKDALHDSENYDANRIISTVIKKVGRYTSNVPVFKYLNAIGITNAKQYVDSGMDLEKWVGGDLTKYKVKLYTAAFFKRRHQTISEIIDSCTPENASAFIPFLSKEKIDLEVLRNFLIDNEDKIRYENSSYASNFRKLASIYDRLKWGW